MEDHGLEFRKELEDAVNQIPEGKIARLVDIADALGDRRAVRAVYSMLESIDAPVWRIVKSDMSIIDKRVEKEIEIADGKARAEIFDSFHIPGILKRLRTEQEEMRSSISLEDRDFETITGADIGYLEQKAYVGLSTFDIHGMHLWDEVFETKVSFPYIPTYLSYREGPPILAAIEESERDIEALMVDGNGILHPKHLGLASFVGIKARIPSIGVAKSLLCGDVNWIDKKTGEVILNGEKLAYALLGGKARNPVYVSPGNMISLDKSLEITKKFMRYRIPEPTRRAHEAASNARLREKDRRA